ncbi:acyltransferase [Bradyrhizobium sp. CCBAU 53351]|uniref:acyltransferase family protein n=1 Tax=Bradyrhizobium sp. CCBAU 53351 TaxID=1325114 RepID=UPI0018885423|nr:acyltransferase [Bradyrhizobium sp. CCBAU 53351]
MDHKNTLRFDVARGVAALVVLVAHVAQAFAWRLYGGGSWLEMMSGWAARFAVLIFFLLSGRLIVASIASNISRNGYFDASGYILSRIARLYPPLLFAVALAVGAVTIVHIFDLPGANGTPLGDLRASGLHFTAGELMRSLLLYNGMTVVDGPLWTLYIEVKLYVSAGGAAIFAFSRAPVARLVGAAFVLFAVLTAGEHYRFWFFASVWCLGAITNLPAAHKAKIFLPIAAAAILLCYAAPTFSDYIDSPRGSLVQVISCVAIAYAFLLRNWAELHFPDWLLKSGDFSYTLYVSHFPVLAVGLSLSLQIDQTSVVVAVIAALCSAAAALLLAFIGAPLLENTAVTKRILKRWLTAEPSWAA